MMVVAMDGNPLATPNRVHAIRLGPAERIDAVVTMNQPGVWVLGETRDQLRKAGMGIVVEYADQQGRPKWIEPAETVWDYRLFAAARAAAREPDEIIPLRFESKFHGQGALDSWAAHGKPQQTTDPLIRRQGQTLL